MPDIAMCSSTDCPVRAHCRRNEASGTVPDKRRQSWIAWTWRPNPIGFMGDCDGWWSIKLVETEANHRISHDDAGEGCT